MGEPAAEVYRAVFDLSGLIAEHTDPDSLCTGLAGALGRVIPFDYLGLALYEPSTNGMHLHSAPSSRPMRIPARLSVESTPVGWAWTQQKPLVIASLAAETRWPEFIEGARQEGLGSLCLVPLTTGRKRLGVLGVGSGADGFPSEDHFALLQRAALEIAVNLEAFLVGQQLIREKNRLQVLFDITNALASKLAPEELFAAISQELGKVIRHDVAVLTLRDKASGLVHLLALSAREGMRLELGGKPVSPEGLPSGEVLSTGRPLVMDQPDFERFPSALYRRIIEAGIRTGCSIPLTTANGILGTLEIGRTSAQSFPPEDVDLLVPVARQIAVAVENALAFRELADLKDKLATEKVYLENEILLDHNFGRMVGESPALHSVLHAVRVVAPTEATVLILGETGTGKELVARALHDLSGRGSFIKVNCAAIPVTLLESELFGHEKGAFTGALTQHIGRFELANQGTLFLDEISEMPLELQSKLLRAIQEQEFERLGGSRTIKVDVRFVAATSRDLKEMARKGLFRSDLYYRLHVFPIDVPPLRDRREDIPLLARHFTQKFARRMKRNIDAIPADALESLRCYDWPGNIRELQNVIERSVILTEGRVLQVAMPEVAGGENAGDHERNESMERDRLLRALAASNGVLAGPNGAAARLGMKRTTLQYHLKKLKISRAYR